MTIPSLATAELCQAARQAGVYVVMGLNERNAEASNGSLYNSLLPLALHAAAHRQGGDERVSVLRRAQDALLSGRVGEWASFDELRMRCQVSE